jgi:hypothetical protein
MSHRPECWPTKLRAVNAFFVDGYAGSRLALRVPGRKRALMS